MRLDLFPFGYSKDDKVEIEHMGIRQWRWIANIQLDKRGLFIGFDKQIKYLNLDWRDIDQYYHFHVGKPFKFGKYCVYYDGHHNGFTLGYVHFYWTDDEHCEECGI